MEELDADFARELLESANKHLEGYRKAIFAMASLLTDEQLGSIEERHRESIIAAVEITAALDDMEGGVR